VQSGLGSAPRPEVLDEAVDRDHPPSIKRERSEQRSRFRPSERDRLPLLQNLERAEKANLEIRVT
jgi:hypothetical protein